MKSKINLNDVNKNFVQTKVGSSVISKDILDMVVYTDDNKPLTIGQLLDQILANQVEIEAKYNAMLEQFNLLRMNVKTTCASLKTNIEKIKKAEDESDKLLVKTSDIMFKKIIRLEKTINGGK